MKGILLTLCFTAFYSVSFAQIGWLQNTDSVTYCKIIQQGKFINKESPEQALPGYYLVFESGFVTEFVNNGQHYLKSKIEFLSACEYRSTVIEVTIPDYPLGVGTIIQTKITRTIKDKNLVEIRSTFNGKQYYFVLEKVEL